MRKQVEKITTLTIDNVVHQVNELPEAIQELTAIYQEWQQDAADARIAYIKCQAALKDMSRELGSAVTAHIKAEEEKLAEEDEPAEVVDDPTESGVGEG